MDEFLAFENALPSERVKRLRGPVTCGVTLSKSCNVDEFRRKEEHRHTPLLTGTDYVRKVREKEKENVLKFRERDAAESLAGGLESLEHLSSCLSQQYIGDLTEEAMNEVYSKYSFQMKEKSVNLPIKNLKQQILDSILTQSVTIIEGPTGCGKTTQVPQWILDDCYQKRKHCKIIVTQPRRIAAISIAKRVAQERGWDVGGLVGYQVGLENKTSNDTRIHYVTTGVLLQKLVASKTLNEYTHIVLDEVHERGQEMDFLLLVVRRFLHTVSPKVKVILMSATFNYEAFGEYFSALSDSGMHPTPCIKVPKKAMFLVKTYYSDHLDNYIKQSHPKSDQPGIEPDMYKAVIKLIHTIEGIDQKEGDSDGEDIPSILIFLPGINEIEELYSHLNDFKLRKEVAGEACANYKWSVLPLHSTITADEQIRVFHRAAPGYRKIILSTNIAESSITVPDVKHVIDFCLMKVLVADDQTNFTSLQLQWASKANCEQRAGRVGRVRDGRIYRLVTERFYEGLNAEAAPEIKRCPLERLVLLAKMLEMGPPTDILALAMDPPDLSNIHRTVLVLKEIGALKKTVDGELQDLDGDITYLGRVMAKLPLDVRASKLIKFGYIFGCLDEAVIIAAAMSVKNIFSSPFRERLHAYNSKLTWADGSTSDCIAFLNVYKVWQHLKKQQYFREKHSEVVWARRYYVQARALRELDDMVRELRARLSRLRIDDPAIKSPWAQNELPLVLKVLIAGAFYPNYFVQVAGDPGREREAVKMLNGHDPRNTVYLKDFPTNQPGKLYAKSIKNIIQQLTGEEPIVQFDCNSNKVYLTFDDSNRTKETQKINSGNPAIPGKVVLPVYKAVKIRQLKMDVRVALLPYAKANELAEALELDKANTSKDKMVPRLPEIDDTYFPLKISQFIDCGRFWVQYDDESTASDLRHVHMALNQRPLIAHTGSVAPGQLFAAPYQDEQGTHMYRVRVHKLLPKDMLWVFYLDYGSYGRVNVCSLRELPNDLCRDLPPMAMECVLAELAPSNLLDQHAKFTPLATRFFQDVVKRGRLLGKVYSVVHGVIAIELLADSGNLSVNKELIKRGFAQPSDESYDSKLSHDLRERATELDLAQKRAFNRQQMDHAFQELEEVDSPNTRECATSVHLKGPFSPLESSVRSLMYASREKTVSIEWNSVNAVLLDTDPQDVYERLLVAGVVGTNEMSDKLTLRHTTLMPKIPGFPSIMTLLFCPAAELRRDEACVRYMKALCGLGCTPANEPLFPEHDLLVNMDVEISVEDLSLINHIRHLIDYMLYCEEGQDSPNMDDPFRAEVPRVIRENLITLLMTHRKQHITRAVPFEWQWGSAPVDELLELSEPDILKGGVVLPLLTPLELRPRSRDQLLELKKLNDELIALVSRTPSNSSKNVACTLCDTEVMPIQAMRMHLYSTSHQEKEEDFAMFNC